MRDIGYILENIISPFDEYCSGSGILPTNFYATAPLIAAAKSPIECSHNGSDMLDKIIAFDRAEAAEANITQTNMITVSSFNGINGAILGYDFLKAKLSHHPLVDKEEYPNIYDATPLFDATKKLLGTVKEKHFPIAPGQHIVCAYKAHHNYGPCMIYGALGIAIPKDRNKNADLYMEDHGTVLASHNKATNIDQQKTIINNLILSIKRVSENLGVEYEKILIGFRCKNVLAGEIGCVITAAPYIHLAKNAIPKEGAAALKDMTIEQWYDYAQQYFLKN